MDNRITILSRLRDYEVQPPAAAFQRLLARLEQEAAPDPDVQWLGAWQPLQELEQQPPAWLPAAILQATVNTPLLSGLQSHELAPPAGAFEQILREAATVVHQVPIEPSTPHESLLPGIEKTVAGKRKAFAWFRIAAAACLLLIAGWGIYRLNRSQPVVTETSTAQQQPVQEVPAPQVPATPAPSPQPPADMARYQAYDNVHTENYFSSNTFLIGDEGIGLIDNDFIVTLASYQYKELPSFLTEEEEGEKMVRLDQYSYFTISENMMNNLRKMYQRRSKGTPTRRARKEMERLEKWKLADEHQFDRSRRQNPLDPIDLAEFIFNY